MIYKIIDIQGIGPVYAEKLIGIGIETVDQLLEKGADAKGRQAIEEATGIRHDLVLTWVNHADLFRVKGIGPQFSERLEAAGVDTVKELRNRNAANLAAKLLEVNEEKHLCRRTPVEKEVQKFIDLAKELEPKVTH
jgi:predicted flap endonuclease-1-like 5' DNA nuclease